MDITILQDKIIDSIKSIATETTNQDNIITTYENKLIEIMGMEAFGEWVLETSKDLFRQEVESMPDCDDKNIF